MFSRKKNEPRFGAFGFHLVIVLLTAFSAVGIVALLKHSLIIQEQVSGLFKLQRFAVRKGAVSAPAQLPSCDGATRLHVAYRAPLAFCYPDSFGLVDERPSLIHESVRRGDLFDISFATSNRDGGPSSKTYLWYQSADFELFGDTDAPPLVDFRCLDGAKSDAENAKCLNYEVRSLRRLSVLDGTAFYANIGYDEFGEEPATTQSLYIVPDAVGENTFDVIVVVGKGEEAEAAALVGSMVRTR